MDAEEALRLVLDTDDEDLPDMHLSDELLLSFSEEEDIDLAQAVSNNSSNDAGNEDLGEDEQNGGDNETRNPGRARGYVRDYMVEDTELEEESNRL